MRLYNLTGMRFSLMYGALCLVLAMFSCKKADKFYETLQALPQIMNTPGFAYKTTYIVGDTLIITGKLQPQAEDFVVTVGGVAGKVAKVSSVSISGTPRDQVFVLISTEMAGKAREVKITSGGNNTLGANIDVYSEGGEGSFAAILSNRNVATFVDDKNIFLHCVNGKGDVYYFAPTGKKLYKVKKDGTQTLLYDLSAAIQPGNIAIDQFVAGGVSPSGAELYFSAKTIAGEYMFVSIDLATSSLKIINRSAAITAPYEGDAANVKLVVSDIYPGENGNVYLGLGFSAGRDGSYVPGAIALYKSTDNSIRYLFREFNFSKDYTGMPGVDISFSYVMEFRINPSENLLYLMQASYLGGGSTSIDEYDLLSARKTKTLTSNTGSNETLYDIVNTFSGLGINLAFNEPATAFGYLPMPGRRLQVLMYQEIGGSVSIANTNNFPRWLVLDFVEERTYLYAQDRFRLGSYALRKVGQRNDELLNYDEDGNLYTTANGRTTLIATRPL